MLDLQLHTFLFNCIRSTLLFFYTYIIPSSWPLSELEQQERLHAFQKWYPHGKNGIRMKLDNVNKIAKGLLSVMSHRRTLRLLLTLYTDIYIITFLSNVKLHQCNIDLDLPKIWIKDSKFNIYSNIIYYTYKSSNKYIYAFDQNCVVWCTFL